MWRPWGKSTAGIHNRSSSLSSSFSCSSFKDIQNLCLEEPPQQSLPSPRIPTVFHRVRLANSLLRTWSTHNNQLHKLPRSFSQPVTEPFLEQQSEPKSSPPPEPKSEPESKPLRNDTHAPQEPTPIPSLPPPIYFPGTEKRVVIYFTSLRVVRPIFEDCKSALAILRAFRVQLDERDVSMDSSFLNELTRIMGRTGLTLPRVFIDGKYIGGGEEIRSMHEIGELKKILECLPVVDRTECHVCAGHRFVLCNVCNGSRKLYNDKAGFKVCHACNENGLLRCPSCFPHDFDFNNEIKN
jgi:glutaredoxin domain-containing cysteine-rich protein 1